MRFIEKHAVPIVVVVTCLLSLALGAVIALSVRGEPGLNDWQGPLRVSMNIGHDYIFVTWDL